MESVRSKPSPKKVSSKLCGLGFLLSSYSMRCSNSLFIAASPCCGLRKQRRQKPESAACCLDDYAASCRAITKNFFISSGLSGNVPLLAGRLSCTPTNLLWLPRISGKACQRSPPTRHQANILRYTPIQECICCEKDVLGTIIGVADRVMWRISTRISIPPVI